jgi:hypothetical protein
VSINANWLIRSTAVLILLVTFGRSRTLECVLLKGKTTKRMLLAVNNIRVQQYVRKACPKWIPFGVHRFESDFGPAHRPPKVFCHT